MSKHDDIFGEFTDDSTEGSIDEYVKRSKNITRSKARVKANDQVNEVGTVPDITPELEEQRQFYQNNFVKLHTDVFPDSTGQKPFGINQEKSIMFGQDVFSKGGRLLKLEPRGFAKTTRITNEALAAVLLGMQDYVVIICSNQEKAAEILDSLKTEIYNNDQLFNMFPGPIACFRHIDDTPQKAPYQTYDGNRTYVKWGAKGIRFPWVPGEPSSGRHIEVRPLSNVKGLHKKIKAGPDAGKIFRPTMYIFDDPQTNDEARSATEVQGIISKIKRDALKGGSHSRRASAIMAITPVCHGDVAWHFEKNEHSWDIVKYKMLESFPTNHEWWMEEYAKIYLNYTRTERGDRTRAALAATAFLKENWDYAHEGSAVTWEHAYGWDEDPQTEVSPVQHAYNIILDDGMEDFEFEYQCNTEYGEYEEGETMHAPEAQILRKTINLKRMMVPQRAHKIVTHIDVNKDLLSFVTLCSSPILEPHIIDYGTHPKQPGLFSKRNVIAPLSALYPTLTDYREVLYKAVKDLVEHLANRKYVREDGVEQFNTKIGIDINYEEQYVGRAIRESPYRNMIIPCRGAYIGPDDELIHNNPGSEATAVYENCLIKPNKSRTLDVLVFDANYFKTEVHRGFNLPSGMKGSLTLFGCESNGDVVKPERHMPLAQHCNSERPERIYGKKKDTLEKNRIVWKDKIHQPDNEFFDNIVNGYAMLTAEGVELELAPTSQENKENKDQDMTDFISQQRNRNLLG